MTRTIVAIEPLGIDQVIFKLAGAPFRIPNAEINCLFNAGALTEPAGQGPVRQLGAALFSRLQDNEAVTDAIRKALAIADGPSYPIGFQITDEEIAALPWEGLAIDATFPALETRWPIVRVVTPISPLLRHAFVPPLRVMAVLSALHRSAEKQWEGLKAAVDVARQQGLPIRLKVLVSEETLRDRIAAAGEADTEVETVPSLSTDLTRTINGFAPQILHFFCHGSHRDGIRRLELATVVDWDQPADADARSSLQLAISELGEATRGIWLVVLNACEGGSGSQEAYSFAHELVKTGLPAAIGMRRAIDALDANTFSAAFFPALFSLLGSLAGLGKGEAALEWADLLVGARRALRDRHGDPGEDDTWTLPVLYVHPTTFELVTNAAAAVTDVERHLGSADVYQALAELLKSANAPSAVVDELLGNAAARATAATT
jgi:hypothetical protein